MNRNRIAAAALHSGRNAAALPTSKGDRVTIGGMVQFRRDCRENAPAPAQPREENGAERKATRMARAVALNLPDARTMLFDPTGRATGKGENARAATIARAVADLYDRLTAAPAPALLTRDGIAARPDLPAALAALAALDAARAALAAAADAPAPVVMTAAARARVAAVNAALAAGAARAAAVRAWFKSEGWQ